MPNVSDTRPDLPRPDPTHHSVIRRWEEEEAFIDSLHAGGAFAAVVAAAKVMHAKRVLQLIEEADARCRAEGDVLWVGPRSKLSEELCEQIALAKPALLEVLAEAGPEE